MESSNKQHLYEIEILINIIFIILLLYCILLCIILQLYYYIMSLLSLNAPLLNKRINFYKTKNKPLNCSVLLYCDIRF